MNDDIPPTDLSASATADPAAATHPHRPPRKPPRKRGPDRGLPAEADRLKLAGVYLELQRELWPQLVTAGVLPSATDAVLKNMSDDLARRHVSGVLDDAIQATLETLVRSVDVAGSYERYSCDNSSRRSIDDQLRQILVKAAAVKQFIPWALVFADASISGADPSRQGYSSLKKILGKLANVRTIYIDEFSRAGRDTLEWFRLAGWARKLHKNVLGASDGFDLNSEMGQMMLHVFAMFSEFFLRQLRDKVQRGMRGAAGRGTSVGRPPLGYGLAARVDEQGRPEVNADGSPINEKRVHPPTMAHVELARRMLLEEGASVSDVVREFNRLRVDGSDGWTDCSIRRTLSNPIYFGFDVYNRTRNEWDGEAFKRKTFTNPQRDWIVQTVPRLRVWDRRTYMAMRRKLRGNGGRRRRSRFAGNDRPSRNEHKPRRMMSALLTCQCGQELKEVRGGKNAAYGCYHGYYGGSHGCTMNSAKAAAVLEEGVLEYVSETLLTPEAVERLFQFARQQAEREAARPPVDLAPLVAEIQNLAAQRQRLIELVGGDQCTELEIVRHQIIALGKQITGREDEIRRGRRQAAGPVPPLSLEDVRREVADLRGLLADDPAAAALVLRSLLGPVVVTHEPYGEGGRYGGNKGARWRLTFTPRLGKALMESASARAVAATGADQGQERRDRLAEVALTEAEVALSVTLILDRRKSLRERLAPRVKPFLGKINRATSRLYTRAEVAAELGFSVDVVYKAWALAQTGAAPRAPRRQRSSRAEAAVELKASQGTVATPVSVSDGT